MSKILIAVGGTGQEIALACLRLCHMAGIEAPIVFVVDSDQGTRGDEVRTRSQELIHLDQFLKRIRGQDLIVFLKPLAENITARHMGTLQSLFSPAGMTPPLVQEVLSLLLTQDQQETSITDGFHGKPTVGSIGVEDYMIQGEFKRKLLDRLDTLTQPNVPHFIVLAGSTTGGTGPGAIPALSRAILEWRRRLTTPRTIEVSGIVQLQWFYPIEEKAVFWSYPPNVDLTRLQRNSACLVRQYHGDLENLVDRLILMSLPEVIRRVSAGPNHQPETLHWLNVLSGWIATELLHGGQTLSGLPKGKLYGYALDEQSLPLTSLVFRDGASIPLKHALDATRVLAAFGPALNSQIGHLQPDLALPKTTFRFLGALRESWRDDKQVSTFLDTISSFLLMDQRTVEWFRDACASHFYTVGDRSSPRDEHDVPQAFVIALDQVTTDVASVGKLLKKPQVLEQDFVAFLLHAAKAHVEASGPETTAVTLYRDLRAALLSTSNEGILR